VIAQAAQGALLGLWCSLAPGPFQALLLSRSLRAGPARAAPLALVPLASDPVAIAATLAVLTQLPGGFLRALGGVGALVVLWLAVLTLREALRPAAAGPGGPAGLEGAAGPGFWSAALVNVTNPNVWIFWSAVGGPILAGAWRAAPSGAVAFLVAFYGCIAAGNLGLVLLAGGIARAGPRVARALGLCTGLALAGFGLWQAARVIWPSG
jgi:threonine/homoserine/homoserine lactone efflux protein